MAACPACPRSKPGNFYLCRTCWFRLSPDARRALNRRDAMALARLAELAQQIHGGRPLEEIEVSP